MVTFNAAAALPNSEPGQWGEPVHISYDRRDVLLYAVGIGISDLRYIYEQHPQFSVFPTFSIRWGGAGAPVDSRHVPNSPGPLNIDAERFLEVIKPLSVEGSVSVRSRLIGVHPKGRGNCLCEYESVVQNADGEDCIRMVNGSFRRGVKELGDIEPFEGAGTTYSKRIDLPDRSPDFEASQVISPNQAHIYRLSGDYNPLHIDPDSAKFGGFDSPILHGLCTFGHSAQLLLTGLCDGDASRFKCIKVRFSSPVYPGDELQIRGWLDGEGRVVFTGHVGDQTVVSNAYFEYQ